ncbi:MAG: aminotransferase class V-fold PLP-dependent enzyme, partial [Candidatus Saccharibacteria bacterium]|nr:aminotransferase class V-fold PLP-dependent enzyme [Candidatus Saccharibacteria bacterium]
HTQFEPGLQAWGEIIALGAALDWLNARKKSDHDNLAKYSEKLHDFLANKPGINLINPDSSGPTMSFYSDKIDSHLLGSALADQGIMARTGYFCVHYYLDHVRHLPPLVRFSLGFHTRPTDIDKVISSLENL